MREGEKLTTAIHSFRIVPEIRLPVGVERWGKWCKTRRGLFEGDLWERVLVSEWRPDCSGVMKERGAQREWARIGSKASKGEAC